MLVDVSKCGVVGTFGRDLFSDFSSLRDLSVGESDVFQIPLYLLNLILNFEQRICEDDVLIETELTGRRNQEFVHPDL